MQSEPRAGIRAGIVAYTVWGLLTIYWKRLRSFDAFELIAWRIVAATAVMAVVITVRKRWPVLLTAVRDRATAGRIALAAVLLTVNWGAYVYAVVHDRVIETALGYFIAPLGTMAIGIVLLGERPTRAHKAAMLLVAVAIVELTVSYGQVPFAALLIAVSWTFYGLCKRKIALSSIEGFAAETFVLILPAIAAAALYARDAGSIPNTANGEQWTLISLAGVATSVPLILFAFAAVRVPFTLLGPVQFLVPTINFLLGWLVYDEPLPRSRVVGFALVWVALFILTIDRFRAAPAAQKPVGAGTVGSAGS